MIKQIRKVKDKRKQYRIRIAIKREKIKKYIYKGYVSYDTAEFEMYQKICHTGRPIKGE